MLDKISNEAELGHCFGNELYQVEVDYLIKHEWAHSAEDILWRRTKLGLEMSQNEVKVLQEYIEKSLAIAA